MVGRERRGHCYGRDVNWLPIFRLLRLGVYSGGREVGNQSWRSRKPCRKLGVTGVPRLLDAFVSRGGARML